MFIDKEEIINRVKLTDICPSLNTNGSVTCPICNKRNKASVYLNEYIKCWSAYCELNGGMNVIQLYAFMNNIELSKEYKRCLTELALIGGINMQSSFQYREANTERTLFFNKVLSVYEEYLWGEEGKVALNYLYARGFNSTAIKINRLGFAPSASCLRFKDIDITLLKKYFLLFKGKEYYYNRIILPVFDCTGSIIHFTGRYLGNILKDENGDDLYPRYKDSKAYAESGSTKTYLVFENKIKGFNKSLPVFVAEGFLDALSLDQRGIQTVGILGLEKIGEQLQKLKDMTTLIFVFDNDKFTAGPLNGKYKSWNRIIPQLMKEAPKHPYINIYVWMVPEYVEIDGKKIRCKDINDWSQLYKGNIESKIQQEKIHLTTYCIDFYIDDYSKHVELIKMFQNSYHEEYFVSRLKLEPKDLGRYLKTIIQGGD